MTLRFPYASMRDSFDLSAYLVLGPDDTHGRPVTDVVRQALDGGVTIVQLRAKHADAGEIIDMARDIAQVIDEAGKSDTVPLLIDDRLDAVLAARDLGIKVDGVHVGQTDVPATSCRELLGPDAIVGLSANTTELFDIIEDLPAGVVDYIGAGAVHPTGTKPEATLIEKADDDAESIEAIARLCEASDYPVVVGGGVKLADIAPLARTKAAGWFVVSAIAGADDPRLATEQLVDAWRAVRGGERHGHTPRPKALLTHETANAANRYVNTLAQLTIWPTGVGEELSEYVAQVIDVIRDSGLDNSTHAMSTDIEGDYDDVLDLVKRAAFVLYDHGYRTQVSLQMDMRPGFDHQMNGKVELVNKILRQKQ
ncbi:MTH1187 family thiamine-binding protein [Bifidobacterium pluvialisilvae]|uniref:MTH1187 family thiamine-binding protein n=1 Tax=Bifidobacterium pluvialisilvae TaxID=2834436 RepID=UPI001F346780|nr:MTH1187 family thiamine-binding protein [Bifidobacterium pluvialisilvae]